MQSMTFSWKPNLRCALLVLVLAFHASMSYAICTPGNCSSYNFQVPVTITNTTGLPALAVMGGNVGVGTSEPAQALHVIGSSRIENTSANGSYIDFVISDASTDHTTARLGTASDGNFIFQTLDDAYTAPVTRFSISRSGQVGIGTESPARGLHLNSSNGMRLVPSSLPSSPGAGDIAIDSTDTNTLKYYNGSTWVTPIDSVPAGAITSTELASDAILTASIADNQVTDSKISSLNVGKIASASGAYLSYRPNDVACSAGQVLKWNSIYWECGNDSGAGGSSSPLTAKGDLYTFSGSSDLRLPVGSNGKVLKADSTQASGLVWGDAIATDISSLVSTGIVQRNAAGSFSTVSVLSPLTYSGGNLNLNTGSSGVVIDGGNSVSGAMSIGSNSSYDVSLKTNNASRITIKSNGSVGIGTTSPSAMLHTAGSIQIGSSATASNNWHFTDEASDGNLTLWNGNYGSGLRRVDISSSGKLGIGTSSPTNFLHVLTSGGDEGAALFQSSNHLGISLSGGSSHYQFFRIFSGGTGRWEFGNTGSNGFYINNSIGNGEGGAKLFISSAGNVGIGTTSPSYPLDVNGTLRAGSSSMAIYGAFYAESAGSTGFAIEAANATNTTKKNILIAPYGGNVGIATTSPSEKLHIVGNLRVQGSTNCVLGNGSGGTSCSSDIRLKKHVRNIPNALDRVSSLRGVEFEWNEHSAKPGRHDIGVIAQEVEKSFPTSVTSESTTGYKMVDYASLVAPLIEATKELHHQLSDLRAENNSLKKRLQALEEKSLNNL